MPAELRAPLILEGGAFHRGRQQARARPEAGAAVRAAIRHCLAQAEALLARPLARTYLADQRRFTTAHCPEAIAEIQGIAAGFDLAEDDVFAYLHLGVLADLAGAAVPTDGCTAWAAPLPEGGALVAKNRDFRGEHAQIQEVFLHRDPAWGGREVLCVGSLGSPGAYSSGISSDGLALVDTQVATSDHGVGWLRYFLMSRLLATCADVAGALAAIRDATQAGGGALVLADAGGSVAAVELGHGRIAIERPQEGAWVARTNHFVSPELASGNLQNVGPDPMGDTSRTRLETIRAALAATVPAPESAVGVMATHGEGGREGLCRHGEDGGARTISTSLYTCRRPQLLFSAGNPCAGPWFRYALTTRGAPAMAGAEPAGKAVGQDRGAVTPPADRCEEDSRWRR